MLEIILSSVVLVAIIQMIVQNKNNKLQYITNERSVWRRDIIEIAQAIEREKKPKKIKELLNRLKLRLNYYGKCYDKYPNSLNLDFSRDQHIWKIIDRIEKGEGNLEKNKIRLLDCLGLLLKYDWERTKKETAINFGIIISAIVYFLGVSASILGLYLVLKKDNMISVYVIIAFSVMFYILAYSCFLLPYLLEKYNYIKSNEKLKETFSDWVMGIIFYVLTEIISLICVHGEVNFVNIGIIFHLLGITMTIINVLKELEPSQRYSNKIIECLKIEKVKIFYYKDEIKALWAILNLDKWNLNSKFYNIKETDEELENIIDNFEDKEKKILKWQYRFWYFIYRKRKSKGLKDYIKKHPKSMNLILEYNGKYTVGCNEKKIDKIILDEMKTEESK